MNNLSVLTQSVTMSSREIAELVGSNHSDVKRSAERLSSGGILTQPLAELTFEHKGNTYTEYRFGKRDSLVLVARLSPEFTAAVVDRWQELEESSKPQLPTDYLSALKALTAEVEQRQQLESQLAIAAPKVEFVEKYVDSTGLFGFRQAAKTLKVNERAFGEFLKTENIMYKLGGKWTAYSNHIDAGRFKVVTGTTQEGFAFVENKFTAKGIEWIAGKLKEAGKVK